jgi:hypothetical protein
MVRFLADENFNGDIVRGLFRRKPELDLITIQQAGLSRATDLALLQWAAESGRLLLTHDVQTLPGFAYQRVSAGLPMAGVVEVPQDLSIGIAIDLILLISEASAAEEWWNQVIYLPF